MHCKGVNIDSFKFWGSEIAANPPAVHYEEIMADDKGVGKWTQKIVSFSLNLDKSDRL